MFHGRVWRLIDLLERGEIAALDEEFAALAQLTAALRQPFYQWWVAVFQAMRALLEGRFGEAEHLAHQAAVLGQRVQDHTSVQSILFTQLWIIRQEQGRFQELQALPPGGTYFATQYATVLGWQVTPAFLASVLGQEAEARREFEILAADDFVGLGWDASWLSSIMMLSQACVFLGDVRRAATLYTLLHPYAGRNVVSGRSLKACYGPVSRSLGLLATLLARWDEAAQHFNAALVVHVIDPANPHGPLVSQFRGTARHVGSGQANGTVSLSGKVAFAGTLELSAANLTLSQLLNERNGNGELAQGANRSGFLPLTLLPAHRGSQGTGAIFETPAGVEPKVTAEVKQRDPKKGEWELTLTAERTLIDEAAGCNGAPNASTALTTQLRLDDGTHVPLIMTMTQPWGCRKNRLKAS